MAVNYTNLFSNLGVLYTAITDLETMADDLETIRTTINDSLNTTGNRDLINDVNTLFDTMVSTTEGWEQALVNIAALRITDRDTITEELPKLTSSDIQSVIRRIQEDMNDNTVTINQSTVTVTPGTPVKVNSNSGLLLTTKVLPADGTTSAGQSFPPSREYQGIDTELSLADEVRIVCRQDAQEGAIEGGESWDISGIQPQQSNPFAQNQGGNVGLGNFVTNQSLISNFFEDFTTDVPDGWTVVNGTATTDFRENTTLSDVLFGESSLEVLTSTATRLSFPIESLVNPGNVVTIWTHLKKSAASTGDIVFRYYIDGIATILETHSFNALSAGDWHLVSSTLQIPINIEDMLFEIEISGLSSGSIFIDGGGISNYNYFGGVGFAVIRGEDPFIINDTFPVNLANDETGKLQRLMTRGFGFQLPSSGTPSIPDPS